MALSENTRGALFMATAMAVFSCNDALVKTLTHDLSIPQIMAVRGVMTFALVLAVTLSLRTGFSLRSVSHPLVLLRTCFDLGATLTYFNALARIDFAAAYSITQSLPLAVTLGAALLFHEPVGWRRWSAIIVGFLGVLLIIQPGPDGFSSYSLLALVSVVFTAARDLTTRRISADIPTLHVTLFTSFVTMTVGFALLVPAGGWQPISGDNWMKLSLTAVALFCAYQTVILAMRSGDISFVAPFRYTSLIWALLIGVLAFGERPGTSMLIGAAIVISSGLYTFYRESRRASDTAKTSAVTPSGV
ncbi:DMT family transporter [Neorhizobium sp. NCHU2750]|uniref:DMT family transporter n=1 Tax=Neorhizobium sp. NCHU2750 TaxID=1825976 RepID=UPI000E742C2D|nr:membrane protein [Neorhizobium sp. NCHU2750]